MKSAPALRMHIYLPDVFFNLGDAGEHPIRFVAEIDADVPFGHEQNVTILEAKILVHFKTKTGSTTQELQILPRLREFPSTLRKWEDAIRSDWLMTLTKDWERGA